MEQKEIIQNLEVLAQSQAFVIGEEYLVYPGLVVFTYICIILFWN